MDLLDQSKALNILVPKLINKTENLQKEMKSRIKLNRIFSKFESRASSQLNYFITNSNKRYSCTKMGNDLKTFLINNRPKNLNKANKILNDKFYSDANLEKEKQKMKYKSTSKIYRDIKDTFDQMKIPLETKFGTNNKKKVKLLIKSLKEEPYENEKKYINIDIYNDEEEGMKTKSKINYNIKENIMKDKTAINSVLEKEQNSIGKSIVTYLKKINTNSGIINNDLNNTSPIPIPPSPVSWKKKINLDLPNIKLMNYRHYKPVKKVITNFEDKYKPDIKKLLPYTQNSKTPIKSLKTEVNLTNKNFPFITETNICTKKINDFHNTVNIVFNSANNELQIQNNFEKRRRRLDDILGINEIPELNTYDEIIFKKFDEIKKERHQKAKKFSESQKFAALSNKEKANVMINNEMILLDEIAKKNYKKINLNNNIKHDES